MTLNNYQYDNPISSVPDFISVNEPLSNKNWFKTGGAARYYCAPQTTQQFQDALLFANNYDLTIFMLGEGANILVHDKGFDGLVIHLSNKNISKSIYNEDYEIVHADAGVSFANLINWCLDNNLVGLEEFSGIPGTVGGSVFINIHYFKFLLSDFLISAQVIDKATGTILTVDHSWFEFGYNYSKLHENKYYLVQASFKVKKVDDKKAYYAQGRRDEIIRHRVTRYPNARTCGSFFRNFYEHEAQLAQDPKKLIYVAYYLEKVGVKGDLFVGDAVVSYQHANMIVNQGHATTQDIIDLTLLMQQKVYTQFGIKPQPECQLIGFKQSPY